MPSLSNPSGGGSYTYVQSGAPDGPTEGETWYDTDASEGYVYTGSTWVQHTVDDHSELAGVGPTDHLSAGSGIAINGGAIDFTDHARPTGTSTEGGAGGYGNMYGDRNNNTTETFIVDALTDGMRCYTTTTVDVTVTVYFADGTSSDYLFQKSDGTQTFTWAEQVVEKVDRPEYTEVEMHIVGMPSHSHTI